MKKYLKTPEEVIDALQAGEKVETENTYTLNIKQNL